MHRIDYKTYLFETFTNQKHCDVLFICENGVGEWESIGAHKFLLMAVSDVFETMFYGKSVENGGVKQENVIKIKDISKESFDMFLRYIYGGAVSFNSAAATAEFYAACDKYNCKDGLIFAESYMTKELSPRNVITFIETADLHNLPDLKAACWKVILEQTGPVLHCSEFLTAKPEMIELLFQQENITIDSENDLVVALERYVDHHKGYDPEIAAKVRPALNCIRFLNLTSREIADTSLLTPEEMRDVIKCLPPATDKSKMPKSFSINVEKRSKQKIQLKDDDMVFMKCLSDVFQSRFCLPCSGHGRSCKHSMWNCSYSYPPTHKDELKSIYLKYNHTFLMEYSSDDIKTVYDIYKQNKII